MKSNKKNVILNSVQFERVHSGSFPDKLMCTFKMQVHTECKESSLICSLSNKYESKYKFIVDLFSVSSSVSVGQHKHLEVGISSQTLLIN